MVTRFMSVIYTWQSLSTKNFKIITVVLQSFILLKFSLTNVETLYDILDSLKNCQKLNKNVKFLMLLN